MEVERPRTKATKKQVPQSEHTDVQLTTISISTESSQAQADTHRPTQFIAPVSPVTTPESPILDQEQPKTKYQSGTLPPISHQISSTTDQQNEDEEEESTFDSFINYDESEDYHRHNTWSKVKNNGFRAKLKFIA